MSNPTGASIDDALTNPNGHAIATALAERMRAESDAVRASDVLVFLWTEIDAALSPVVGKRGVAALYSRSVHIAARRDPWLAALYDASPNPMDLDALKAAFVQRYDDGAPRAAAALMQAFSDLLANLVGPSLTDRLLSPVVVKLFNQPDANEDRQ